METCYKVFRTDLLKSIPIRSDRFGFEPEITIKCAKRRLRIYEVPISYHGRTYEEGKKIGWKDGIQALGVILKYWLVDDLYLETQDRGALINLTRTPAYINWVCALLRPHLGDSILEVGAGIGIFSARLMGRRLRYTACESDPIHSHALRNRFLRTPSVEVSALHPADLAGHTRWAGEFDTAVAINVLESLEKPEDALAGLHSALKPAGRLLLLAPAGKSLYGSVDRSMGQLRRFDRAELAATLAAAGFEIESIREINKAGRIAWWLAARLLRRRRLSKFSLKVFDKTVWLWRLLDRILPWPGLSMVIVARRKA
jgi:SAM-dependent methyltransferase